MSEPLTADLNSVIVNAVNARVEAAVMAALSGDDVLGKFVTTALGQEIEVKLADGYRTKKITFLKHVIDEALRSAVKRAVEDFIEGETELLKTVVAKELRKQANTIAIQLVGSMATAAERPYGVKVELAYPNR